MRIGTKIRKLRDKAGITQPELAYRLGISQATLCNIESGETKKIDFLLMDKICKEFDVDFEYFIEEKQVNRVKENNGTIAYSIDNVNNCPENLIENIKSLINDNIEKTIKIKELEEKLRRKNEL